MFALGIKESDEGWTWFLQRLKECTGDGSEVAFISDMPNSIKLTLSIFYPDSYHRYCCMNIVQILEARIGRNRIVEGCFEKHAKSITCLIFSRPQHANNNQSNKNALTLLDNIAIAKWGKFFFP